MKYYLFIDESGRLADKSEEFVVIAGVLAGKQVRLGRIFKDIRKRLPLKGKRRRERKLSELKFVLVGDKTKKLVLEKLRQFEIVVFLLILNKKRMYLADTPKNYGILVARLIQEAEKRFKLDTVFIDRHFERKKKRDELGAVIRELVKTKFEIKQPQSYQDKRVNLADFVAGATWYEKIGKSGEFKLLFKERIAWEEELRWFELFKTKKNGSFAKYG